MTFNEARALIGSVRYGPAFPLRDPCASLVRSGRGGDVAVLLVSATVADRSGDGTLGRPMFKAVIDPAQTDATELLLTLRQAWRDLVLHEIDEGIWIGDELPFDPHRGGEP